jgi:asparagine synthase (glutamine-hydrolysing)
MCGIAGWIATQSISKQQAETRADTLSSSIARRGPDADGRKFWHDGRVSLLHRRLAIIDPTPQSNQPFTEEATGASITFNGEIYNFRALAQELKQEGVELRTHSDTEVILLGYIKHGVDFFRRLRGMYAFAIFDPHQEALIALRDSNGIKPLYWAANSDQVMFSSAPLGLAKCLPSAELDPAAAVSTAILGCVLEPLSKWKGIRAAPPGVLMEWKLGPGGVSETRTPLAPSFGWPSSTPGPDPIDDLQGVIFDSVEAHFTSDVPVAVFQSAGLDSTLISTAAHRLGRRPTLLTLGFSEFKGTSSDEVPLATETAQRLGLEHHVSYVGRDEFSALEADFFETMENPTADGLNTYILADFCKRSGFKVGLSGVGADELFGGYPSFQQLPRLMQVSRYFRSPPAQALLRVALGAASHLVRNISPKIRYGAGYIDSFENAYLLRKAFFLAEELPQVLRPDIIQAGQEGFQAAFALQARDAAGADDATVRTLERDVYLRNMLLKDTDWTGMAHGVEIRTPFVDVPLHRALCDPTDHCRYTKDSLRTLLAKLDPAYDATPRAKKGFMVPHMSWASVDTGASGLEADGGSRGWREWDKRVLRRHFGDWAF